MSNTLVRILLVALLIAATAAVVNNLSNPAATELTGNEKDSLLDLGVRANIIDLVDQYPACKNSIGFWQNLHAALSGKDPVPNCPAEDFATIVNGVRVILVSTVGELFKSKGQAVLDYLFYGK